MSSQRKFTFAISSPDEFLVLTYLHVSWYKSEVRWIMRLITLRYYYGASASLLALSTMNEITGG